MTYIDFDERGHRTFAAYQYDTESAGDYYGRLMQQIERSYDLQSQEISSRMSVAKTGAAAQVKSASIAANATIKAAKIRAEVDRYGIDVNAAVERERIGLAREEMLRIGIPSVLVDAWTAEKNYEVAKMDIGLNIARTIADLRSTPDKYWLAADFEAVLPAILTSASGVAGGGQNGAVGATGMPNPNSLEGLVGALMGTGGGGVGGAPASPTAGGGGLFEQIKAATAGTQTGDQASRQQQLGQALLASGLAGVGSFPVDKMTQTDLDMYVQALKGTGSSPDDPRIMSIMRTAQQLGYNVGAYDDWWRLAQSQGAMAEPINRPGAGGTAAGAGANPNDAAYLAGISAMMAGGGVDPFLYAKLNPTQQAMLTGGLAKLGYEPSTEIFKALTRLPGQGDVLAA